MRINNNLMAVNTHRQLGVTNTNTSKAMEKLSSGFRINRAGDDAAGLSISEKMRGQIRGLNQASRNAQDGISLIQTAEGALTESHAILQRMRELAAQSANDTNVEVDRGAIQAEMDALGAELTRIAETTEFNTQKLLDGDFKGTFHIGANEGQDIKLEVKDMSAEALKVVSSKITGELGAGVTKVEADLGFDLTGVELAATKGGAIAAELTAKADGVGDGFAKNITGISSADGITSTAGTDGQVPTLSAGGIANQISISASDDIDWEDINTTALSTITIGKAGDNLKVDIEVTDSTGAITISDEFAQLDANGNYVYDAHGISFTISAEDFAAMADDTTIVIDLATAVGSGANTDILAGTGGVIGTKDSWEQNVATTTKASFEDGKILIDHASLIDGVKSIKIEGGSAGSGRITVTLFDENDNELSKDVYQNGDLTYNNHGISFELEVGDATVFEFEHAIEAHDTKVTPDSANPLKFNITDDNGTLISGIEVALNTVDYSLEQVATAINSAVAASSGSFAGDVASIVNGNLVITSAYEGASSKVQITDVGGLGSLFATSGEYGSATGGDDSIELTLKDADGNAIDTKTVAPNATTISFKDADKNNATFSLKGYQNLDNVNIEQAFSASGFNRELAGIDILTNEKANKAITIVNDAIEAVSSERSKLGAIQNRLEHTIKNLDTSAENLQASESRIRDVDMAKEMMELTKQNILQQAATAMLAQANMAPQGVLQLLG